MTKTQAHATEQSKYTLTRIDRKSLEMLRQIADQNFSTPPRQLARIIANEYYGLKPESEPAVQPEQQAAQ